MKIDERRLFASLLAVTAVVAACGGGGDGGSSPVRTPPTLAITPANRDLVSHDAAAAVVSLSATTSIPLGGSASVAVAATPQRYDIASGGSGRWAGPMLSHLRAAMPAAGRHRVLAMTPPMTEACMMSGSTTTTVDDHDNDGTLSAGDSGTVVFNACRDDADETIDGTMSMVFSKVDATYFAAHATMSHMSTVTAGHSLTLDGSTLMEAWSDDAVHARFRTTAEGPVQAAISTHLPFSDTTTLGDGFVIEENVDTSIAPPTGAGPTYGRTLTTVRGRIFSASANGTFDIATDASAPITRYHAETYPRAGVLRATGRTGVLVLTTTSPTSVVLDLDWNDDGVTETSEAKPWDWLI
jgi:hypothetical protein